MKNTRVEAALCGGDTAPVPPEHPLAGLKQGCVPPGASLAQDLPPGALGAQTSGDEPARIPAALSHCSTGFLTRCHVHRAPLPLHISDSEDGAAPWVWVLP